ncbi:MAG: lipoyl(octanoyl) transferase LipB [Myxococcales bacterium]|nr:lipoyl(octanoyl) transferase LipB [Myxococcales bacterium]
MTPPRPLEVRRLGRVPYREAWALQQALVAERLAGTIPDTLLLLEHDPVITLGRAGSRDSLLHDEAALAREGVELVHSDRGGDATWHGPGQVVGYAILDLRPDWKDVRRFVSALEQTMIDACADFGVAVGRVPGAPGVFVDGQRKIGAIGARFTRWISHHGFALNVCPNLSGFRLIIPCGLRDKGVTSLEAELGRPVAVEPVMDRLAAHLATRFEREVAW